MDSSWGIVIVSIVGTVGTVLSVILANRHSYRLAAEQREFEARAQQRQRLIEAFTRYMDLIDELDGFEVRHSSGNHYRLLASLDVRDTQLSAMGTPAIASAARALSAQYQWDQPLPVRDETLRALKDDLTRAVRDALVEA